MTSLLRYAIAAIIVILISSVTRAADEKKPEILGYVGSQACKECHEKEYASFMTYAKKSKSYQSIERLRDSLSASDLQKCYSCHTTGYGKPGGFISEEQTPHLKNAGCEVCHGPGARHVRSAEPGDIKGKMTMDDCVSCHTSERVTAFRFKPLIHGGAH